MPFATTSPEDTNSTDLLVDIKPVAKNAQDVESWFAANLRLLDIPPPDIASNTEVNLGFSILDAISKAVDCTPVVKAYVTVSVTNNAKLHPSLNTLLTVDNVVNSSASTNFRMYMSFDDWPFLTAHLAILALLRQTGNTSSEELLQHYLPKHFPGMSWAALQGLHSNELLPVHEDGSLDEPAVQNLLFALRDHPNVSVTLPEALSS